MRRLFSFFALFVGLLANAAVYVPKTVPNPKQFGQDYYVSNPDFILSSEAVDYLNRLSADLNAKTTVELAVVAIEAMDERKYFVEKFAQELFNYWGIGNSANNNGVLILLVTDSRDIRIQTGGGAEGILPDEVCSDIIYDAMVPYLSDNDWNNGIVAGAEAIYMELVKDEHRAELMLGTKYEDTEQSDFYLNWLMLAFFIMILSTIPMYLKYKWKPEERNKIRYKNASAINALFVLLAVGFPLPMIFVSRWWREKATKKYFLDKPVKCKVCNNGIMKKLPDEEVSVLLDKKQTFECDNHSAEYEFWKCESCGNQVMYRDLVRSKYRECTVCGTRAAEYVSNNILERATTEKTGKGQKMYKCRYCGESFAVNYVIPKITKTYSSDSSESGGSYSRSYSSSSSSSGSWGGGSSYGGGASGKF